MSTHALVARRVLTEQGVKPAAVVVEGERIAAIVDPAAVPPGVPRRDLGDLVLAPGLVDAHVHLNEPGRTEWEGFETATRAAAAGGVTTLVDMPLNSIPATTTLAALESKRSAARGQLSVDCAFWGGLVPGNLDELPAMVEAGVSGFKCFLVPSGVDEFGHVGEAELRPALKVLETLGVPLLVHAEIESALHSATGDPRSYSTYLKSRPRRWENDALSLLVRLAGDTGAAVHVVHLSSSDALPVLAAARREGLPLTAETCPHYLAIAAEEIPDGRTEFKCAPPIREAENREKLWDALHTGLLDVVVSDHSPCIPERKGLESGDFLAAWGGIASLQLRLSVTWTEARRRGASLADLARWLCRGPAELAGLGGRKGRLVAGYDADLVAWNPEASFDVEPGEIRHRWKVTPYAGRRLDGVVEATWLRGALAYERGGTPKEARGQRLARGQAP
jgi:allantoinase